MHFHMKLKLACQTRRYKAAILILYIQSTHLQKYFFVHWTKWPFITFITHRWWYWQSVVLFITFITHRWWYRQSAVLYIRFDLDDFIFRLTTTILQGTAMKVKLITAWTLSYQPWKGNRYKIHVHIEFNYIESVLF